MSDDNWVQRTSAEYAQGFNNLLPTGPAWPRDPSTALQKFITGLAQIWGTEVETLSALLLTRESDPRMTTALLPEWERAWGLPDACLAEPLTVADRRNALVNKMTLLGAQSRQFFIDEAAALGYKISFIREWSPFMCGISTCGDTRFLDPTREYYRWEIGPPEMRFYWSVNVSAVRYSWFRASSGQAGVDPHLTIGIASDLECVLNRWKPAHTQIIFNYSPQTGLDFSISDDSGYLALSIP